MILYSIVPSDIVYANLQQSAIDRKYITYDGTTVEVSPVARGQYRVNRVISTRPRDYLNPKLQPGIVIEHLEEEKK